MSEQFGNINDVFENVNGYQGNLVYIMDRQPSEVIRQYNEIKQAKQIIAAYSINNRHCLVVAVDAKVKIIKKKKTIRSK